MESAVAGKVQRKAEAYSPTVCPTLSESQNLEPSVTLMILN